MSEERKAATVLGLDGNSTTYFGRRPCVARRWLRCRKLRGWLLARRLVRHYRGRWRRELAWRR